MRTLTSNFEPVGKGRSYDPPVHVSPTYEEIPRCLALH